MKFLVPLGGFVDHSFGIITSPEGGIFLGVSSGMEWASDMGCISGPEYVKRFDAKKSFAWLESASAYRSTCLFVTAPDHVGNARATLQEFGNWDFGNWRVAYIAQDGQEDLDFPASDRWDVLFIGGSTKWKESLAAIDCIVRAQRSGKGIHIGRVNWRRRYDRFSILEGSERFTCDGTRTRYGKDKAIRDWKRYMGFPRQYSFLVSVGNSGGESADG